MSAKTRVPDRYAKSKKAFAQARALMPGGVSSPVRAYQAVGTTPVFAKQGEGCRVTDLDGNVYVDYVLSYGPLILGHAPDRVVAAVTKAARKGASFGMPTVAESTLAQMVINAIPSVELVRFVNSGTEAVMSALRLARAVTGRSRIIKAAGCYHGHSDGLLVQAGSGATTLGVPSSPGVPASVAGATLLVPYNDAAAVEKTLAQAAATEDGAVAAVVIEPVAGNMGCVPPKGGYLAALRKLCDQYGALLIFDEVMTGFRVGWSGAQGLYGIRPDLTCLGKVIGGGLPCAAYAGAERFMRQVAPDGPVYQAGTLSGNPLAMAAGVAMLESLRDGTAYAKLEESSAQLASGLIEAGEKMGVPLSVQRVGSMFTPFFVRQSGQSVTHYQEALGCDTQSYATFFRAMLDRGVLLPPSQFEAWFVSTEHDAEATESTLAAARAALAEVAAARAHHG